MPVMASGALTWNGNSILTRSPRTTRRTVMEHGSFAQFIKENADLGRHHPRQACDRVALRLLRLRVLRARLSCRVVSFRGRRHSVKSSDPSPRGGVDRGTGWAAAGSGLRAALRTELRGRG